MMTCCMYVFESGIFGGKWATYQNKFLFNNLLNLDFWDSRILRSVYSIENLDLDLQKLPIGAIFSGTKWLFFNLWMFVIFGIFLRKKCNFNPSDINSFDMINFWFQFGSTKGSYISRIPNDFCCMYLCFWIWHFWRKMGHISKQVFIQ